MSRKKVFLLLISLVVMMSLFSNAGFAATGLGGVAETIHNLFGFIPDILTLDKLVGGTDKAALFWAKFLIWLLLFSVLYFGAGFVFKERNRISTIVALVIAIMGTVTIPNSVIIGIFQTYSLAAGLIVWFIPVGAGLYVAHKIENRLLKAVFYLLLLFILINMDRSLTTAKFGSGGAYEFFSLLLVVVIIAFFWNLFAAFGGPKSLAGSGVAERVGGGVGDWLRGNRRDERHRGGEEREEKEPIQRERHTQQELESIQNLRQRLTEMEAQLQEHIENPDIRQRFNNILELLLQLRQVQQDLDAAENEIRGMTRG